jgi:formylglycine-generating enzyme required for sulfatase activity
MPAVVCVACHAAFEADPPPDPPVCPACAALTPATAGSDTVGEADRFPVLYEMLTGARAFRGATVFEVLRQTADHHPAPPHQLDPSVPEPLSRLTLDLLAKRPEARPPSARAVADRLAVPTPPAGADLLAALVRARADQDEARRLADERHDYAAAGALLDGVPPGLRDADLYAAVRRRRDRVAELARLMEQEARGGSPARLRRLAAQALLLQPQRDDLRRLLEMLPHRPDPEIVNSIGMALALVPAGVWPFGARDDLARFPFELRQRHLRLDRPFYLGRVPVTQEQFERVTGRRPARFPLGPRHPVESVFWEEALRFCEQLSELADEQAAGRVYRLPTETEWECACRAGSASAYWFGDSTSRLREHAWFQDNSGGGTHEVGRLPPNPWGLYDMHGNVWEWCADAAPVGAAPRHNSCFLVRGGAWDSLPGLCRSSSRCVIPYGQREPFIGFRVACDVPDEPGVV